MPKTKEPQKPTVYCIIEGTKRDKSAPKGVAFKTMTIRSTVGDTTRPQPNTWSWSANFTNPTIIRILDSTATGTSSQASSYTIQEGV